MTGRVNQEGDHAAGRRGSDTERSASGHVRACSRRLTGLLEGADASVTQAVVDVGEQLAGHRDGGDVAASSFGDAIPLAALEGHFRGPALAWPELIAATRLPDPDHAPAERLLLLLPVCADRDRPADATEIVAAALSAVGARSDTHQVGDELLNSPRYWARGCEWTTADDALICLGTHAYGSACEARWFPDSGDKPCSISLRHGLNPGQVFIQRTATEVEWSG